MYYFAAQANLFTALGLNWKSFILNGIAFMVVVVILKRFVYPSLIKALDNKISDMGAAERLKAEAQTELEQAAEAARTIVREARVASDEILSTTKSEATEILEAARLKAEQQAERTLVESREQLRREVESARVALKRDLAQLVTAATEAVIEEKLDGKADSALIERSLVRK